MKTLSRTSLFTLFALVAAACVPCAYGRGRASGYCQQGGQTIQVLGYQSSATTPVQGSYTGSGCNVLVLYSNGGGTTATGPSGVVNTAGTAVMWLSGNVFNANGQWTSLTITINAVSYTIGTCASAISCTLTSSAGTQTSVAYSMSAATPAAVFSDNAGTPKSNPFTVTGTGYWFYYADNGSYANQYSGTAIPTTYTNAALPLSDPSNLPDVIRWNATLGTTLAQQCTAATAAPNTAIVVDTVAPVASGFAASCPVFMNPGGLIQPASGQTVTINAPLTAPRYKVFDCSVAGAACISFNNGINSVLPEWFGASTGTSGGATDTLYTPLLYAVASLPVAGPSPDGTVYQGSVSFAGTGVQTNRYNLAQTFSFSPRVSLLGAPTAATYIGIPTGGFTGNYMFSAFSATGNFPNDNFNTEMSNFHIDAYTNMGMGTPGCISWGVSLGSYLSHIECDTAGIGLIMGGNSTTPSIDTVSGDNLNFTLELTGGGAYTAQAIVWASSDFDNNTTRLSTVKVKGYGNSTTLPCSGRPALDLGITNFEISIDTLSIENHPCGVEIGDQIRGATITNVYGGPDCYTACTLANNPWLFLIAPEAHNVYVKGTCDGFKFCVVLGHMWRPQETVAAPYKIVDIFDCIQLVTGNGITANVVQPAWGGSSASGCTPAVTTTDGTATWTNQGALSAICGTGSGGAVNLPCAMPTIVTNTGAIQSLTGPPGATSGSDPNFYDFVYDSNTFWGIATVVLPGGASPGTSATTVLSGPNYSPAGNETGSNNAIAIIWLNPITRSNLTPIPGTCFDIVLSHSLRAGANTLTVNGGSAIPIVSHYNRANNIATAYVAGSDIRVCLDYTGGYWMDQSQ